MRWQGKLFIAIGVTLSVAFTVWAIIAIIVEANRNNTRQERKEQRVEKCRTALSHLEAFDNLAPTGCGSSGCSAVEKTLRQRVVADCRKAMVEP